MLNAGCGKEVVSYRTTKETQLEQRVDRLEKQPAPRDGRDGVPGAPGQNGKDGIDGKDGVNGKDGEDGEDGADAPTSPFTIVGILNPCGDASGIYDEIFLKLENGTIVSSFSDSASGQNTRFVVMVPGTYVTSDGDHCYFTITSTNQITNEHH